MHTKLVHVVGKVKEMIHSLQARTMEAEDFRQCTLLRGKLRLILSSIMEMKAEEKREVLTKLVGIHSTICHQDRFPLDHVDVSQELG
ncbi:hypothetical protein ACOSQ3_021540 [Xanthoceras sorbifolium]